MLPLNPWEHQSAIKALYTKCVEDVCGNPYGTGYFVVSGE